MKVFVVHGTELQSPEIYMVHAADNQLESIQKELVDAGVGPGQFFHTVNDEYFLVRTDEELQPHLELYYQVVEIEYDGTLDDVFKAIQWNDQKKLWQLVPDVFDVNKRGIRNYTMLEYAYHNNRLAIFRRLLELGAAFNNRLEAWRPYLLHNTVSNGSLPFVKLLLEHGADPNKRDGAVTLLMLARDREMADLLIKAGADVNAVDGSNRNLLHKFINRNLDADREMDMDFFVYLLDSGVNINGRDNYGSTPLIDAATHGLDDVVEVLLEYGADKNINDDDGMNAERNARQQGYHELADDIRDYEPPLIKEPEL